MYKNLKMAHYESAQYVTLRNNLDIYNNILKKCIWLQKSYIMKHVSKNISMV